MIEVKNVTKKYGDFTAVEDISFKVEEASVTGLIGYNGAGKTTLLKTAAGVYKADAGKVLISGEDVYDNNCERKRLFYVPDDLFFPLSASLKSMASYYAGYYKSFSFENFDKLVKAFGLDPSKRVRSFSKGMQRQAEIILGLSTMPKYMLLDETFDGLDPQKRELVKKLLLEYMSETGCSLIISSHNLPELNELCDRIVMLNGKRVAMSCDIGDVSANTLMVSAIFENAVNEEMFAGIAHQRLKISGKGASMLLVGDVALQEERLRALSPTSVSTRQLSLEEVFLNETEESSREVEGFFKTE